jgi:Ca2+-binding RTX toxin-like protein
MRNVMKGLVLGAIALMVIGGSIPASAKAPLKEVFVDEGWFTLPDIGCTGFTLTEVMDSESVQVTTFYNKAGDEIKVAMRANFFGTITNTLTGDTFRDHASFTETVNLVKGTTTVNGISYHYVVGGQGQVFAEIGHKIMVTATGEVIFQGGQDDLASDPDLLSLCEFMA